MELVDNGQSPEEWAISNDERCRVFAVLKQLTGDQRQVVELRLAGLTGPEIAGVLGRNRGWVNVTQYRAVERLREILGVSRPEKEERRAEIR
jgi:RNA polymerase sigma factor (sigma-70 family)